ncbi:PREDICTED: uncharacterized protein LOC108564572 [Nicrophorus vespilloides]|uniref:Uncharacterized protein LOC108564572 n=1 Tax=Nicrophorus vespilloides TaxID=110193 RepID=A0ABM1MX45_NICVS|nr:PREDICTED: uncharacterized protein LOC108564572 [Nicrophorus vespilloides]
MDPWATTGNTETSQEVCSSFEDNFKPETPHLPDSDQYLATLESKLQKIKNDPDILKQLAEKKESCMQQLISGEALEEEFLETPVNYGPTI